MRTFLNPLLSLMRYVSRVQLCGIYNDLSNQFRDIQDGRQPLDSCVFTQTMTKCLLPLSRMDGGIKALNLIEDACGVWDRFSTQDQTALLTCALSTLPEIIVGKTRDAESKLWVANHLLATLAHAHGQKNLKAFNALSGELPNKSRVCLSHYWECGGDFSFVVQRTGDHPTYALPNIPVTGSMGTVNMASIDKFGSDLTDAGLRTHLNETFMIRARDVISSPTQPNLVEAFRARAAMCVVP